MIQFLLLVAQPFRTITAAKSAILPLCLLFSLFRYAYLKATGRTENWLRDAPETRRKLRKAAKAVFFCKLRRDSVLVREEHGGERNRYGEKKLIVMGRSARYCMRGVCVRVRSAMAVFAFLAAISSIGTVPIYLLLKWHDLAANDGINFCCGSYGEEAFCYTFFLIIAVALALCIWKLLSVDRDWFGEGEYYKRLEEENGVNYVAYGLLEEEQNIETVDKLTGRHKEGVLNDTEQVYIGVPVDINSLTI